MKLHSLDLSLECYLSTQEILKYNSSCAALAYVGEPPVSEGSEDGCAF